MSAPAPALAAGITASPLYRWFVLLNVMVGTFMAVLDASIVNVGLSSIMAGFGSSVDTIQWVITAYMLATTIMLPVSGWLADNFGYKKMYGSALLLFTVGSLLCGLAWNERTLIFFRVVQGTGAGLLMPLGMAIVMREFPREQRGMVLGFWGIAAAASISLGPMTGGFLIDRLNWRAIFTVNVPVGSFGVLFTAAVQKEYRKKENTRFDFLGCISMTVFLAGLLLALSAGNARWNTGGWSSDYVLTCFAVSFVGLLVFLAAEITIEHPMIELRLFRNFNFAFANSILFIFGVGMFGSTFLMPLYLQTSLGYTALQTGLMFLPIGLIQGTLSPLAGMLADRTSPKLPGICGIALLGFSLYRNSLMTLQTEPGWITATLILRGIGAGLAFTPLNTIAVSEIPREKMAQASGMLNVIRQVGGSVGVAIMGAIEAKRVVFHTAMRGLALDPNSPALRSTLGALQTHAMRVGSTPADAAAQARSLLFMRLGNEAFVAAVNDCFMIAGIVTLLGVVPLSLLRRRQRVAVNEIEEAPATGAETEGFADAAEEPLASARPLVPPTPHPEPKSVGSALAAK